MFAASARGQRIVARLARKSRCGEEIWEAQSELAADAVAVLPTLVRIDRDRKRELRLVHNPRRLQRDHVGTTLDDVRQALRSVGARRTGRDYAREVLGQLEATKALVDSGEIDIPLDQKTGRPIRKPNGDTIWRRIYLVPSKQIRRVVTYGAYGPEWVTGLSLPVGPSEHLALTKPSTASRLTRAVSLYRSVICQGPTRSHRPPSDFGKGSPQGAFAVMGAP